MILQPGASLSKARAGRRRSRASSSHPSLCHPFIPLPHTHLQATLIGREYLGPAVSLNGDSLSPEQVLIDGGREEGLEGDAA